MDEELKHNTHIKKQPRMYQAQEGTDFKKRFYFDLKPKSNRYYNKNGGQAQIISQKFLYAPHGCNLLKQKQKTC